MNQKELNEIRRRLKPDRCNIQHIYGCYVNSNREIISWVDAPVSMMTQDESIMYLALLKKSLSGALGKNLIDIVFSTQQVVSSDEHRLLQTLRTTALKDREAREKLCRTIINSIDMGEQNYLILLGADTYDIPHRGKDGSRQDDQSEEVYQYFVCSICPVKSATMELRFYHEENEFHGCSTGNIVSNPELGFLFPAFDDRSANIYNALFYSKNVGELHQEVIDSVFCIDPPMSAPEQKNVFDTALSESLEEDCSYDVVQSVHEQIRVRIEDHKESKDPEPLEFTVQEVGNILRNSGVSQERVQTFQQACKEQYGEQAVLNPNNLIDKKFEIKMPDIKISVAPESSYLLETRVIDGRRYFLVPIDGDVEVNGVAVKVPGEVARETAEVE